MKTRAKKENIDKYENVLNLLFHRLKCNSQLSMLQFSKDYGVSKNLSTVLSKGGIIKHTKKGRASKWEWTSISPTRDMAVRVLQELGKYNPPRKKINNVSTPKKRGGKRECW